MVFGYTIRAIAKYYSLIITENLLITEHLQITSVPCVAYEIA